MKKLWERLRHWLIRKLKGITAEHAEQLWDSIDSLKDENRSLRLRITELESKNLRQRDEIGSLKMQLDRNPPAWKGLTEQTLAPRIIRSEKVIHREPEMAADIVGFTKDELARQVLEAAKPAISYHFQNDFAGNSRVSATLGVFVNSGDL